LDSDLRDFKARVLEATDIVALVGEYVALRRSGSGYKGLCPFHEERTPSFSVSPERGSWYCFGRCAKGGNAVDFLIDKERLEFWSALTLLAERAGVPVPQRGGGDAGGDGESGGSRKRLLEMHRVAASFFRTALWKSREGESARAYVSGRGIDPGTAERFGLGYAPRAGRHLLNALGRRGYAPAEALQAGLASEGRRGVQDRFRGRLVFPIHDVLGRVVGFGARTLDPERVPKYLNTPETPIFKKRELVYGLHLAKDGIREAGKVAVVEGYTDVILAHQAGLPWFVATLGTAFGAGHARVLRRFTDRVVAFFDGDAAGAAANRRTLEELASAVFGGNRPFAAFRVASVADGLDPAEVVTTHGPEALQRAVETAEPFVHALVPRDALTWPSARRRELAAPIARVLAAFESDLERDLQLKELAHRLGLGEDLVRSLAAKTRTKEMGAGSGRQHAGSAADSERSHAAGGEPGDEAYYLEDTEMSDAGAPPQPTVLELHFLRCVLALGQEIHEQAATALERGLVVDPAVRRVAERLCRGGGIADIEESSARALASREAAALDPDLDWRQTWAGVLARLEQERERRRAARLGIERPGSDEALRAFQDTYRRLKARQHST
jgi:DNA primase